MANAYTVVILILSTTPLSTVICSMKRSSEFKSLKFAPSTKELLSGGLNNPALDCHSKNLTIPFYLCVITFTKKLNEGTLLLQQKYIFEKLFV